MSTAVLRARGQLTLPQKIRKHFGIKEGDTVLIEVERNQIVIKPQITIDPDQAWFWTEEWQKKEREADEAVKRGDSTHYESDEEFLAALKADFKEEA